jgi:hypothetical protein
MPRRAVSPRNSDSRRDRWAYHEIISGLPRQKQARNDAMENAPYGTGGISIALSGTAVAGGVLESEIVSGGETLIITLSNDTWVPAVGDNNAITTALIAGITGNDAGDNGWDDEVAIAHGNVARTSDTVVTITLPEAASYSIIANETVTVAVPAVAVDNGITPTAKTFTVTEGS